MSSQRRIDSSRANGAKSRGATTPEGKARIVASNVEHGILARSVLLTEENTEHFSKLFTALEEEHCPQTETEHHYVQNLLVARWRLVRIWNLERTTLQNEMAKTDPRAQAPATRCAKAFQDLADESRTLDLLHRYETRYQRQHDKSLQMLQKMKQLRENQNLPRLPVPKTDTPEPPASAPPESVQTTQPQSPAHPPTPLADSGAQSGKAPEGQAAGPIRPGNPAPQQSPIRADAQPLPQRPSPHLDS